MGERSEHSHFGHREVDGLGDDVTKVTQGFGGKEENTA